MHFYIFTQTTHVAKSLSHPLPLSLYSRCVGKSSFRALKLDLSFLLFTVGLYGAGNVNSCIALQSNPDDTYQACPFILLAPPWRIGNLSLGSFFKSALISSPTGP